ncbi:hypothetical protein AWB68_08387 [Caballeronia choica]|uniref:Uncharacterized protein n=1 Tax=Caballeronia choica TaxID=326476 RepID=A0A158L2C6_9BURK|nr:hypothetical protein AWB68_08387 [Caballeronia choica]
MLRKRAPRDRSRDDAAQIEHAHARERPVAWLAADRHRRCIADADDLQQRQPRHTLRLRQRGPLGGRTDQRGAQARIAERLVERRAVPAANRLRHRGVIVRASQHFHDARAMVREVRVKLDPAPIARLVEAGERIAQVGRGTVVDAQITLAAKRDARAPRIDLDVLRAAGAVPKALGRGERLRRDHVRRERRHAIHRRQLRIAARRRDERKRGRIALRRVPKLL